MIPNPNPNAPFPLKDSPPFDLSPSVMDILSSFKDEKISAARIVRALFDKHPEFAAGKAGGLRLSETPTLKTASEWLEQVQELFDWEALQARNESRPIDGSPEKTGPIENDIPDKESRSPKEGGIGKKEPVRRRMKK